MNRVVIILKGKIVYVWPKDAPVPRKGEFLYMESGKKGMDGLRKFLVTEVGHNPRISDREYVQTEVHIRKTKP